MVAGTSNKPNPQQQKSPAMKNNGWICIRLKPTVCGPFDHVQTVFSQAIRAANDSPKGARNNQVAQNQTGSALFKRRLSKRSVSLHKLARSARHKAHGVI